MIFCTSLSVPQSLVRGDDTKGLVRPFPLVNLGDHKRKHTDSLPVVPSSASEGTGNSSFKEASSNKKALDAKTSFLLIYVPYQMGSKAPYSNQINGIWYEVHLKHLGSL